MLRTHALTSAAVLLVAAAPVLRADRLELVEHVSLWEGSPVRSPDCSGITYHPATGRLLVVDSEVSEYGNATDGEGSAIFSGHNVFEVSLDRRVLHTTHFAAPSGGKGTEPTGIAYNAKDGHLYVTDDDRKRVFRYRFDDGKPFGPPVAETGTAVDGQYTDPEGIACDPGTGVLYVVSGTKDEHVLRLRFDADLGAFVVLDSFPVGKHIRDPEGIGIDPQSGNVFLVSGSGIAEFARDGTFVQLFDYSFLKGTGVVYRLPGGLTFAPSSDPNDHPDSQSLYITCRGIDNGAFPKRNSLDEAVSEVRLVREPKLAAPLRVPADHATIQAAIDAARDGDTVLVSAGTYRESIVLGGKSVTLASEHYTTGREALIDQTIIDGGGAEYVIKVAKSAKRGTTITGFTLRNADDGIAGHGPFTLSHCHVTKTSDGIDFERAGGLVQYCRFTRNRDDGIDLDGPTAATIEHCLIVDNRDDGIEIRLHPYTGETLQVRIRNNRIERNGEDGIQLIDYGTLSDRHFLIEGNVIADSAMAGIGCMADANTREDYSGAAIPEPLLVINNTFARNNHHLTGGGNVLAANNVFVDAKVLDVKNVSGRSLLTHNLFWRHAVESQDPGVVHGDSLRRDPRMGNDYRLAQNSPAADAGAIEVTWAGEVFRIVSPAEYRGRAPDLGAVECW